MDLEEEVDLPLDERRSVEGVVAEEDGQLDEAAARLIRDHEIDILVDLQGQTLGARANILAYRPAAIQECDHLLVLEDGSRRAFGPRDQVLRDEVKNHTEILRPGTRGAAP